jgi:hypothetical protein
MHGQGYHVWRATGMEYNGGWNMGKMHGTGILTKLNEAGVKQRFDLVCDSVGAVCLGICMNFHVYKILKGVLI